MRNLIFKTEYLDLIREGKKIQTIRVWPKMPRHTLGEVITASNYKQKLRLKLIAMYMKKVMDLTEGEAIRDGFNNTAELFSVILKLYGGESLNAQCVVIRFERI